MFEKRAYIKIFTPKRRDVGSNLELVFCVEGLDISELFFAVESKYQTFLSDKLDAALVALLPAAMYANKDICLEGVVSESLLFNVNHYVIPLLLSVVPGLHRVEVTASDVEREGSDAQGEAAVLTGLSCGIDSFTVVHDYLLNSATPDSLRITHFIFNEVGSHGSIHNSATAQLFERRAQGAEAVAQLLGKPIIRVKSNLDYFYKTPFQQTHTMRNTAVAFALQGQARHFLYASTVPYKKVHAESLTNDICKVDPLLLPLLSTESLRCHSAGAAYSRVEKTLIVSKMEVAKEYLDVCVIGHPNCSGCFKCARTLLTLDLLGCLEDFTEVFNLTKYRQIRKGYIVHIFATDQDDPFIGDLRKLYELVGKQHDIFQMLRIFLARCLYASAKSRLGSWCGGWRLEMAYKRVTGFNP